MVKIIQINQTGKAHRIDGRSCEDALFVSEAPFVCCLADGVSNSTYGGLGAKHLVDSIGHYLTRENVLSRFSEMDAQSVRQDFVSMISQVTNYLCQHHPNSKPNDFAATFMACFIYQDTLTIVHAGDGAIFALHNTKKEVDPVILSYPDDNQFDQVYHAAHKDTISRLRVLRLRLSDLKGLILGTDGFTNAYLNPSYQGFDSESLLEAFDVRSNQELTDLVKNVHIREHQITDDISAIVVRFQGQVTQSNVSHQEVLLKMPEPEPVKREAPPLERQPSTQKKRKLKNRILPYVFALLAFAIVIGLNLYVYFSMNTKLDELSSQLAEQQTKIDRIENLTQQNQLDLDSLMELQPPAE